MALVVIAGCGTQPSATPTPSASAGATPASVADTPSPTAESALPTPTPSASPHRTPTPSATPSPHPKPTPSAAPTSKRVIVIDPGHSGRTIRSRTVNGLSDIDYPNYPEIAEAFDISTCVAQGLRTDGYTVILTKQHVGDSVSLTERAEIANRAKADLAISVHDDHGQGPRFEATYSQRGVPVDGHYPTMYRGTGSRRTVFDRPAVAAASDRAAKIIARERTSAQRRPVTVRQNSYDGRAPLEPGNLAIVQLLADVPWVYNEMGALTGGSTTTRLTLDAETGYADGLLDGVEAAVPNGGSHTTRSTLHSCLAARR